MPTQLCPNSVKCLPCPDDSPVLNLSAEAPDEPVWVSVFVYPNPHPLGDSFGAKGCLGWEYSTVSQADADASAAAQTCDPVIPDPGPDPGPDPDPDPDPGVDCDLPRCGHPEDTLGIYRPRIVEVDVFLEPAPGWDYCKWKNGNFFALVGPMPGMVGNYWDCGEVLMYGYHNDTIVCINGGVPYDQLISHYKWNRGYMTLKETPVGSYTPIDYTSSGNPCWDQVLTEFIGTAYTITCEVPPP